jgi:hypothetical protein
MSLSMTGTLEAVKDLLSRLQSSNRLIHCQNFSLGPVRNNPKEVVLDLELLLFDLTEAKEDSSPNAT